MELQTVQGELVASYPAGCFPGRIDNETCALHRPHMGDSFLTFGSPIIQPGTRRLTVNRETNTLGIENEQVQPATWEMVGVSSSYPPELNRLDPTGFICDAVYWNDICFLSTYAETYVGPFPQMVTLDEQLPGHAYFQVWSSEVLLMVTPKGTYTVRRSEQGGLKLYKESDVGALSKPAIIGSGQFHRMIVVGSLTSGSDSISTPGYSLWQPFNADMRLVPAEFPWGITGSLGLAASTGRKYAVYALGGSLLYGGVNIREAPYLKWELVKDGLPLNAKLVECSGGVAWFSDRQVWMFNGDQIQTCTLPERIAAAACPYEGALFAMNVDGTSLYKVPPITITYG
jgi:hypothetical protein